MASTMARCGRVSILGSCLALAACNGGSSSADDDGGSSSGGSTDDAPAMSTGAVDDSTGGGPVHIDEEPGCDPLVPQVCAFPFPSTFHLTEDASTATGMRVALPEQIVPPNVSDPAAFVAWLGEADGFSRSVPFFAIFDEQALDTSNFSEPHGMSASLQADAPVQVFDLDSGTRIPTWTEIERRGETPADQALIIRPMQGLPFGARVGIVITDSLHYADGSTPTPSPAFAALRDGTPTDAASVEDRRADFDAMFDTVEAAGVARESIILAWQTVIVSHDVAQRPLPQMVEAAAQVVSAGGLDYTVTTCVSHDMADVMAFGCTVDPDLDPRTWRRFRGTVRLPNYLDDEGRVQLDDAGVPIRNGDYNADFTVNVPEALRMAGPGTAMAVGFGHGLLSNPAAYVADDNNVNGQVDLSNKLGAVFIGTRWLGLSSEDQLAAANLVTEFNGAAGYRDLLAQGITNQVMMVSFLTETLADDPLLAASTGMGSVIDPTNVGYTGISQGGIFGATLLALSPFVTTGVLHVPSSGYVHLLPHSALFVSFQDLVDIYVPELNDQQVFFGVTQRMFDVGDPINYAEDLVQSPVTALGPKNALLQCAVGDTVAGWFGCDMLARTAGLGQVTPAVHDSGLPDVQTPTAPGTSALQFFDPQLGDPQLRTDMPLDVGAHGSLRRNDEVQLQTVDYFDPAAPGTIVDHCGGPCVIDPVPPGG